MNAVTLSPLDSQLLHAVADRIGFDAFGHHAFTHERNNLANGLHKSTVDFIFQGVAHEGAVNLDDGNRQTCQIAKR